MKNALVAWIEKENVGAEKVCRDCIEAFSRGGYAFCETRFLYAQTIEEWLAAVEQTRTNKDNLLFLLSKEKLALATRLLSENLDGNFTQGTTEGEGVFEKDGTSLFLLSFTDGASYAQNVCVPHLDRKYASRRNRMVIRCVGANKKVVGELLQKAENMSGDLLSFRCKEKYAETIVEIFYDMRAPKMLTDDVLRLLMEGLGDSVYALDDTKIEEQLVTLLKLRGKKIAVAESFTGGGVGKRIVSVSGASEVYYEGINAYNERAKQIRLGVLAYTLNTYGAVSDSTAYEMAAGLLSSGNCDVAIATTGIAGPKSDRYEQPVGLCYIAVGTKEKIFVFRYKLDGTREEITETAINYALFEGYRLLKNR